MGVYGAIVFQSNILFIAWPTLHGVLPPEVFLKVLAQDYVLRKISQSLSAGAIFPSWIGIFCGDGASEFALESVPTLLGCSRHLPAKSSC